MRSKSYASPILVILALCIGLCGVYILARSQKKTAQRGNPLGTIVHLTGSPKIRNSEEPFWKFANLSDSIFDGQKLKTSQLETVIIKTNQNEIIRVAENTTITIQKKKNEPLVKLNIGNIDVESAKDKNSIQKNFESFVQESRNLVDSSNVKIVQNGKTLNLGNEQSTLLIFKPENKSTHIINEATNQNLELVWIGKKGNHFEIEVSYNNKPPKAYRTRSIEQIISLEGEATNGTISWRVKDNTLNKSTDWSQFNYYFGVTPVIAQPKNGDTIFLDENSIELFKVSLISPYQNQEIEWVINDKIISEKFKGSTFSFSKSLIPQVNSQRSTLISIRLRSEILTNHWTVWSPPVSLNLSKAGEVKILQVRNSVGELTCENGEWKCNQPIFVKIISDPNPLLSYSSKWYLPNTVQVFSTPTSAQDNSIVSTCPPFPHSQWRLRVVEKNIQNQQQVESMELKVSALSRSPPQPNPEKAYLLKDDEIGLSFPTCPFTYTKSILLYGPDEKEEIITDSSSILKKINKPNPVSGVARFLDLNYQPVSPESEVFIFQRLITKELIKSEIADSPTPSSKAETQWILKDAAKIYVAANESKAWTPISWKSKPTYERYEYQLATDQAFTNIIETNTITNKSVKALIPESMGTLFWRVRGINQSDYSPWSPIREVALQKLGQNLERSKVSSEQAK